MAKRRITKTTPHNSPVFVGKKTITVSRIMALCCFPLMRLHAHCLFFSTLPVNDSNVVARMIEIYDLMAGLSIRQYSCY